MWATRSFLMAHGRFGPVHMLHELLWGPPGQTRSGLVFLSSDSGTEMVGRRVTT